MPQNTVTLDFFSSPLDAVAAYWLSLRKLVGNARSLKALEEEALYVAEPFVRHLLDMALSDLSAARFIHMADVGSNSELARLDRQIDFMRITIMDIAQGENPLRTLARMAARFASPAGEPEAMLENAQELLQMAVDRKLLTEHHSVDHHQTDEALCTTLLFYAILARRHGKAACRSFLTPAGSRLFADGLALVIDGFDAPFVRKWLKKYKKTVLSDMQNKMALSTDMCMAIQERVPFEVLRQLVRSYIR